MKIVMGIVCALLLSSSGMKAQDKTPAPGAPAAQQTSPGKSAPASPSPTAESPKRASVDREKEKDIRRLLELAGTKALMEEAMAQMEKSTRPILETSLPAGIDREKFIQEFFVKFRQKLDVDKMMDMAVPIYDKYFSLEEVKGLIQFYETPLGQKSISVLPRLSAELMESGRRLGEEAGRQSMLEVLAQHPELEKQLEDSQKSQQP